MTGPLGEGLSLKRCFQHFHGPQVSRAARGHMRRSIFALVAAA